MKIICESELWFAKPSEFNDPFECQAKINIDEFREKLPNLGEEHVPDLIENYRADIRESLRVLSLSELNDDLLMWGHYGDCHRGLCIGFDVTTEGQWFGSSKPVVYSSELPIISGDPESIFESVALSKAANWAYEKEWRVAEFDCEQARKFPNELLVEIIFGCDISDADRLEVLRELFFRSKLVQVYQARRRRLSYGLEIVYVGNVARSRIIGPDGTLDVPLAEDEMEKLLAKIHEKSAISV